MAGRGRPKEIPQVEAPRKFKREYIDDEGIRHVWRYNLDITEYGPIEVELFYPNNYKPIFEKLEEQQQINSKIPLKYQTFLNPKNGKQVAYGRAKQLGLI